MATKSERTIVEALGLLGDCEAIDFSDSPVSGVLETDATYRLAADEDCYVKFTASGGDGDAVDADDTLIFSGVPEVFQTSANSNQVNILRKDQDGTLHCTKMKTPRR